MFRSESWQTLLEPEVLTPRRKVGPDGFVKIRRDYRDERGIRIRITGWSSDDGGFVGVDAEGVFRIYNVDGLCITKHNGQENVTIEKNGEIVSRERKDLHLLGRPQ